MTARAIKKYFLRIILILLISVFPIYGQNSTRNLRGFTYEARLRMNSIFFDRTGNLSDYSPDDLPQYAKDGKLYDPLGLGIGFSAIISSPDIHGLSMTVGYYHSNNLGILSDDDKGHRTREGH